MNSTIVWRYKSSDPNISNDYITIENVKRVEFNLDGNQKYKLYGLDGETETVLLDVDVCNEADEMIDYYGY